MGFLTHLHPDVLKVFAAVVMGGTIGLEREVSNKVAGLRTNILICVGAALFTIVSLKAFDVRDAHVPAQIIAGIGFLGAGAILRDGEHVVGLTTAATIWTVAAVGMGLGFGDYFLCSVATVTVLFVQLAFTPLDTIIDEWQERHHYRIICKFDPEAITSIERIFQESNLHVIRRKVMKRGGVYYSEWFTSGGRRVQERVMKRLMEHPDVMEATY